jgi:GNAT superfamily N-acetyltransferase
LPPSSPTSRPAASTAPARPDFVVRVAAGGEDVAAIHAFLLAVAPPALLAPVDPVDSIGEVYRVVNEEAAFVALADGEIVGTLGIVMVPWWYNRATQFLTDRWCFVSPAHRHKGVFDALIAEADALAARLELAFIFNGKSRRRDKAHPRVAYTSPRKVVAPFTAAP